MLKRGLTATSYISAAEAAAIDTELFKFWSVDQLMELAGLSCAVAVTKAYPKKRRVLCVAGKGNNGGDCIVAARHLKLFGYEPTVVYPIPSTNPLFHNLVAQCRDLEIPVLNIISDLRTESFDLVLDGIFGFSFRGTSVRPPFDEIITAIKESRLPICSIDVPSGWDVEKGNVGKIGFDPETLISLTAPKKCAAMFNGKNHFLGGRFISQKIAEKYGLRLPRYPGVEQVVRL